MASKNTENTLKNPLALILGTGLTVRFEVKNNFPWGLAPVFFHPLLQHRAWFGHCTYLNTSLHFPVAAEVSDISGTPG